MIQVYPERLLKTATYSVHISINGFLSIKLSSYSISMSPRCLREMIKKMTKFRILLCLRSRRKRFAKAN